jgi:large subunit ribosomal protein L1
MGAKHRVQVMTSEDKIKIVAPVDAASMTETGEQINGEQAVDGMGEAALATEPQAAVKAKKARSRSMKYQAVRAQIDKTTKYDPFAAVELVKKLSYTSFPGTVTAHLVVKEAGISAPVTLPHSTGKTLRVAIVNDEVMEKIASGVIDFDVLLATPQYMPKLAKFAPVLGPKGLMPNPKNGTLTPNPEAQQKKLAAGTTTIKTEKKAPLIHVQIGKTSMDTKDIVENLSALMKAFNTKLVRVAIAATMCPGVKVDFTEAK